MAPWRSDPQQYGSEETYDTSTLTPEEEATVVDQMDRVAAEKRAALQHPGPSWKDWFLFDNSRWWIGLVLLILDGWLLVFWFGTPLWPLLFPSLAAAGYAEFLLWQYLYHRPADYDSRSTGGFERKWYRPVPAGRWTPEGVALRAGAPVNLDGAPDPREFL
jgi:hypothetical protein